MSTEVPARKICAFKVGLYPHAEAEFAPYLFTEFKKARLPGSKKAGKNCKTFP